MMGQQWLNRSKESGGDGRRERKMKILLYVIINWCISTTSIKIEGT